MCGDVLQLHRNAEAALKKAGYITVFSGKNNSNDELTITAQQGAQWISVQTGMVNDLPIYTQTSRLVKQMQQEMTAGAQAIADAINASGKLDLYGINFATGSAAISPESDKVLTDILAVLSANADWQLRGGRLALRKGHCDWPLDRRGSWRHATGRRQCDRRGARQEPPRRPD